MLLLGCAFAGAAQEPYPIVDYDQIPAANFETMKPVLDKLARVLKSDPGQQGYVFIYGGRRGCAGEADERVRLARNYLSGKHKIPRARFSVLNGGYREELVMDWWLRRQGEDAPVAVPTVDPSEVKILKPRSARCRRKSTPHSRHSRV